MQLTLMFREYCSLCHHMQAALQPYQAQYGFTLDVVDVSEDGFQARTPPEVPMATWGQVDIELGPATHSSVTAATVRRQHVGDSSFVSFRLNAADSAWTTFTKHLSSGTAHHPA